MEKVEVGMWFNPKHHIDSLGWKFPCIVTSFNKTTVYYRWEEGAGVKAGDNDIPLTTFLENVRDGTWVVKFPKEHYLKLFKKLYVEGNAV